MKNLLIFLFCIACSLGLNATNYLVKGVVKDQNGNPKSGVTIIVNAIGNGNSFSTLDAIQTDSNGAYSTTFASPIDSVGGRVVATMIDCDNRTSVKTESFGHANNVTTIEIDFNYCQRISNNSCQVSIRRIGSFLAAKPSGGKRPYSYLWSTGATTPIIRTNSTQTNYCVTVTDRLGCVATACYQFTPRPCRVEIAGHRNILKAFPFNVDYLNVQYAWSTGDSTQTININAPGTYCVTMTTTNCVATKCITVKPFTRDCEVKIVRSNVHNILTAVASDGQDSVSYHWNTGANTSSVEITNDRNEYCVTVSSANCFAKSCYIIRDTTGIDSCGVRIVRDGNILRAFGSSGSDIVKYEWDNGQNTSVINIGNELKYCVKVLFANGCSAHSCIALDSNSNQCAVRIERTSSGLLYAFAQGTGPFTFHWNTGANTSRVEITPNRNEYCVTVTNDAHCVAKSCIEINSCSVKFDLSFNGTTLPVLKASVPGNDALRYNWSTGSDDASIRITSPGTYCVTITTGSGCVTSDCYVYNPNPTNGCQVTIVRDGNTHLVARVPLNTGSYTYHWNTGSTASNVVIDTGRVEYCVTVTNVTTNCTAKSCINISGTNGSNTCGLILTLSPNGNTLVANPTGTGPFHYTWSADGGRENLFTLVAAGTYCVTATSANGCAAAACYVYQPIPGNNCQVTIVRDGSTHLVARVPGSPSNYLFYWNTGANTSVIEINAPGVYVVEVESLLDTTCISRASIVIQQLQGGGTQEFRSLATSISPNPVAGTTVQIAINSAIEQNVLVEVYDLNGRKLKEMREGLYPNINTINLDVSQYTNGLYMLRIIPSKGESTWLKMSILR